MTALMNQDQRELLELAAYAIGLEVTWREIVRSRIAEFKMIKYTKHCGFYANGKEFNSLADLADAGALMAKLRLNVTYSSEDTDTFPPKRAEVTVWLKAPVAYNLPHDATLPRFIYEDYNGNPEAATMLAITRAAAAIGKQMKGNGE